MSLPPIFYHYFPSPLPYARTLALQERLHQIQLAQRRSSPSTHKDILLLLQHRPVFTAGRRQTDAQLHDERARLTRMGADFAVTARGGELTYHGPGQLVGYPLLDLGRGAPALPVREYVCRIQRMLQTHLKDAHGIAHAPAAHTGVFVDGGATKLASIGVQVRHRLTTHGFALNVTREPLAWFDTVVACGLADVKAGCIEGLTSVVQGEVGGSVEEEVPGVVEAFGRVFEREMQKLELAREAEVGEAIAEMEEAARPMGDWPRAPLASGSPRL